MGLLLLRSECGCREPISGHAFGPKPDYRCPDVQIQASRAFCTGASIFTIPSTCFVQSTPSSVPMPIGLSIRRPLRGIPDIDGTPLDSLRLMIINEAFEDIRAFELLESLTSKEEVMHIIEDGIEPITFSFYPANRST